MEDPIRVLQASRQEPACREVPDTGRFVHRGSSKQSTVGGEVGLLDNILMRQGLQSLLACLGVPNAEDIIKAPGDDTSAVRGELYKALSLVVNPTARVMTHPTEQAAGMGI